MFHHFDCVSWIHPGRLGWNFPYEHNHRIRPGNRASLITGFIWRGPKSAIDLTKTPFQLHDILSYAGSKITYIRKVPTGNWNIFMVTRWKMWSPNNSVKKFFLHGKTQKRKVFKTFFCMKIFILRNDHKNQILCVKALKCHVVEMVFSSNR